MIKKTIFGLVKEFRSDFISLFQLKIKSKLMIFFQLALNIGGKSIGEPKSQNDSYYSCYILDLDGYLLEAVYRNKD